MPSTHSAQSSNRGLHGEEEPGAVARQPASCQDGLSHDASLHAPSGVCYVLDSQTSGVAARCAGRCRMDIGADIESAAAYSSSGLQRHFPACICQVVLSAGAAPPPVPPIPVQLHQPVSHLGEWERFFSPGCFHASGSVQEAAAVWSALHQHGPARLFQNWSNVTRKQPSTESLSRRPHNAQRLSSYPTRCLCRSHQKLLRAFHRLLWLVLHH